MLVHTFPRAWPPKNLYNYNRFPSTAGRRKKLRYKGSGMCIYTLSHIQKILHPRVQRIVQNLLV